MVTEVNVGINLYKTLVTPHLGYAILAWASIAQKHLTKLENLQNQYLNMIIGSKAHSVSSTAQAVAGALPSDFGKGSCLREHIR